MPADQVEIRDGRREMWLDFGPRLGAGYVCAEPDHNSPEWICGMPVESEPCDIHRPGQED